MAPLTPNGVVPGLAQPQARATLVPPRHETVGTLPVSQTTTIPAATLRAASGATIEFRTQNGHMLKGVPSHTLHLPHLVLYRNGRLTAPGERTLIVEVTSIQVPPAGVTVTLQVETQHNDPDDTVGASTPISVWYERRRIINTSGFTRRGVSVTFRHTFGATAMSETGAIATPTDYFRYQMTIGDADHPNTGSIHTFGANYAFLMENQWIVQLPKVGEASPGAAPNELVVYYSDMFPFRKNKYSPSTWLSREKVAGYVQSELIPQMIEAFLVQTDVWGFVWYPAWTGCRQGADVERLSVALADGETWYHGTAPVRGHMGISINVNGGKVQFDTLTDGVMSSFHHELFHHLQRNIHQHHSGTGDVDGKDNTWQLFSEGTAALASAVGQPDLQFNITKRARTYLTYARNFTGHEGGLRGDLNKSYASEMTAYHAAIYWRFLYEQCGGTKGGIEDPAAGMDVIRRVLTVLYSKEIVDICQPSRHRVKIT